MPATAEPRSDIEVEQWRLRELKRAGYERPYAELIAANFEIDLHEAIALLKAGCPSELALDILL